MILEDLDAAAKNRERIAKQQKLEDKGLAITHKRKYRKSQRPEKGFGELDFRRRKC